MERVVRHWEGLTREVWSPHPCMCSGITGHGLGDEVGIGHGLDLILAIISNLSNSTKETQKQLFDPN